MPDTWLINFMHQLPQRNQLCLNQLTLLCISLQQDVRRSALQKITYCTGFMYWPIVIIIIWTIMPPDTKWEQSAHSTPSKCEKIRIIHLLGTTKNSAEEQLATVAVLVSTGRILIRGKQYKEWGDIEFPVLVHIVNSIEWIPPCPSNNSLVTPELSKFFQHYIPFFSEDEILVSNHSIWGIAATSTATEPSNLTLSDTLITTSVTESLSITPSRLSKVRFSTLSFKPD